MNCEIHQTLVDNGSSIDLLYIETFGKMNIGKDKLRLIKIPLIGFGGKNIIVEGAIQLPVTMGGTRSNNVYGWFLRCGLPFYLQFDRGKTFFKLHQSSTSTYALAIKFPTVDQPKEDNIQPGK